MARFSALVCLIAAACVPSILAGPVGGGQSGPACAAKHRGEPDCVEKCSSNWGWTGSVRGASRWGPVVLPSSAQVGAKSHIAAACGSSTSAVASPTATSAVESGTPAIIASAAANSSISAAPSASFSSFPSSSSLPSNSSAPVISTTPASKLANLIASTRTGGTVPTASATRTKVSTVRTTASPRPVTTSPSLRPVTTSTPAVVATATASPSPAAAGGGSTSSADIQAYLEGHNSVRRNHGAADLTWSDTLAAAAQKWANNCQWKHSGGAVGDYGENLATGTGNFPISSALKLWTDEVSEYNANNPVPSHFTQVVWKGTTEVGCAVQTCTGLMPSFGSSPAKFYVCEYNPAGNIIGRFPQNVQA